MKLVDQILSELEHAPKDGRLHLYALLDAARENRVPTMLRNIPEHSDCLYEGQKARDLAPFAPYLVEMEGDSPFLKELAMQAVGGAYCVFLSSKLPYDEMRRHFRHFLMVQTEDGKEVYFRFYDPRVLRVFLPNCTPEELKTFMGPIQSFWVEAREPGIVSRFSLKSDGLLNEERFENQVANHV